MATDIQIISVIGANGQPLPVHGTGLGSDWSNTVKQEREDDAEINELAAKIKETQKDALAKAALQNNRQVMPTNGLTTAAVTAAATQSNYSANSNGQTNIMNYLTRQNQMTNGSSSSASSLNGRSNGVSESSSTDKKLPLDEESQKGRFGWTSFGKIHIPFIFRTQEKYCSVRMIESKLLGKYLNCLHPDIYSSCTCVRSYYITEAESRLFNEINTKHCDNGFGRDIFTQKDLVVRLNDATKFYQFLDICYRKLIPGNNKTPSDKCGFIRINKESVVPYTLRNNEQVVPLFYFEGETENLKQKADYLSGWDLAYLKFCCKVQGIRNELFSSENVAVISLTDIKSYFPNGTEFEDYWPSKVVDSNLLLVNRSNVNNSVNWTRQPAQPPPKVMSQNNLSQKSHSAAAAVAQQQQQMLKRSASNSNANTFTAPSAVAAAAAAAANQRAALHSSNVLSPATVQALNNGSWLQPSSQAASLQMLQAQMLASQAQQSQHGNARGQYRNPMENLIPGNRNAYVSLAHGGYNNASISMQAVNNQSQGNAPPPLVRAANGQTANHMSLEAATAIIHQQQQQQQQQQQRLMQAAVQHYTQQNGRTSSSSATNNSASIHLQRHAAMVAASSTGIPNSDNRSQRLSVIPEIPSNSASVQPYKMQKVYVDKQMVPCINMKAYNDSDQLMTLTDFQKFFCRTIPLDRCKKVFEHLEVELYKGNRRQLQVLMEHDRLHDENIPLVQVRDVLKYMTQLQYMAYQEQLHPSKRTRNS